MEEKQVAPAGSFCWNEACPDYGQGGKGIIIKNGKTDTGVQRYRCQSCKQTFTETKGTLFYRCRHSEEEIVACMAMLGERTRRASIHRVKGIKEETIARWMQRAATQVERLEEQLVGPKKLSRVQWDAPLDLCRTQGRKRGKPEEEARGTDCARNRSRHGHAFAGRTCDSQARRSSRAPAHATGQRACPRRSSTGHVGHPEKGPIAKPGEPRGEQSLNLVGREDHQRCQGQEKSGSICRSSARRQGSKVLSVTTKLIAGDPEEVKKV